jgi:L-alanine-DL-glutamate epimerase-like enolase superfamily enzyme
MAVAAQKLVDKGYNYLKIKVHGEVDEDVARVAAIRRQVGDDVHLTIDANQSYTTKDAIAALNRMAEYRIDLCEQPVSADDFEGLALVTRTVPVTVEADEAAGSLRDIFALVSQRAVDAVSLKIPKLGGLRNTVAAARLCRRRHCISPVRCRASTMLANSVNSIACSTTRSKASKLKRACCICRWDRHRGCG